MILDFYFARRFLQSFVVIGVIFLALIMLIDMIEQLRKFEGVDVSMGQLVQLMLLNTPAAINEILPLLMILSTIVLFVGMARSSELIVARATGRSGIRSLAGPVIVALLIGGLAVSTLNPIVSATSNHYQSLSDTYRTGGPSALSLSGEGLWLRQGTATGQSVIHATGFGGGGDDVILYDVTILSYAPGGNPVRRIQAEDAQLLEDEWVLHQAKVWPLVAGLNPESNAATHAELRVPTSLTENRIRDNATNLHGREGIKNKHDDLARAANPVSHINGRFRRHRVPIAGYIGDQQRIGTRIHANNGNACILGNFQPGSNLRRIDIDHNRVHLLVHGVFKAADHGSNVPGGVHNIYIPALVICSCLEAFHVELRTRLRQIRGDHGDLPVGACGLRQPCNRHSAREKQTPKFVHYFHCRSSIAIVVTAIAASVRSGQ